MAEWFPFRDSGHLGGCGAEVPLPFYCAARHGPCVHTVGGCRHSGRLLFQGLSENPHSHSSPGPQFTLCQLGMMRPAVWNLGRPCLSKADGNGSANDMRVG